jgi:tetratricopeptide (TPR) repeat protein
METKIPKNIQEQIHRLVDGKLSQTQSDELWTIMLPNPAYIDYMQTAIAFRSLGKDVQNGIITESVSNISKIRSLLVAAAVLLIIGLLGLLTFIAPTEPDLMSPLTMIELNNVRSSETSTGSSHLLQTAISHLVNNETIKAREILETIRTNPQMSSDWNEAILLSGIIYYNERNFEQALAEFNLLSSNEDILMREESLWYSANAHLHLQRTEEAMEILQKVIALDGAYSRAAQRLLQQN